MNLAASVMLTPPTRSFKQNSTSLFLSKLKQSLILMSAVSRLAYI